MNILYIAYSCNPHNGTEDKLGWQIPLCACKENNVVIITKFQGKKEINYYLSKHHISNIKVIYYDVSDAYKKIFKNAFYSGREVLWVKQIESVVKKTCETYQIDVIHQLNPVEFRSTGDFGKFGVPFICGPLGGGEYIPRELRKYCSIKDNLIETIRYGANCFYRFKYKCDGRFTRCSKLLFANQETKTFVIDNQIPNKVSVMTEIGADSIDNDLNSSFTSDATVFLAGGRLIYRKGFDFLLDAIELVPENYNFKLKLFGYGQLEEHIRYRIKSSDILSRRVQFLGKIDHDDMAGLYKSVDYFIMPSLRETTGSVIIEALENGVPIITCRKYGAAEILNDDVAIFYRVERTKPEKELEKAIIEAIEKKAKSGLLVTHTKCLKLAEIFSYEKKYKVYKEMYDMSIRRSND